MSLYWQDVTQRGEQKSYQKLRDLLRHPLDRKLLDKKNKNAWSRDGAKSAVANKDNAS